MTMPDYEADYGKPPLRLRIPNVLDVLLVSEPAQMAYLDRHASLERQLDGKASWLHRFVAGRLQKQLAFDGKPLPVFVSRKDRERALRQQQLHERLDHVRATASPERETIAHYLAGKPVPEALGPLVQRWCGRLFDAKYQSSEESFAAGRRIARFPSSPPWRSFIARLSGRLAHDKQVVSARAQGDLHCIHATSIGTENIVRTLEKMRKESKRGERHTPTADEILRRCLVSPPALLRSVRAELSAPFLDRPLSAQTLVIFLVARAYAKSGDLDVAFLANNWSACPARGAVIELLRGVWHSAHHGETDVQLPRDTSSWSRLFSRALS